jgi:isoleucyl-tRNA synthetase
LKETHYFEETTRVPLDLKSTVNLPKTAFPMKASLPQREPQILARWEEMDIYGQIRAARAGAPLYVLHDGPPYANGPLHLGHALNKCLKDFIVKSKTMAGFDSPYVPGWDCHGLPIEIKVDQKLGGKKLQMNPSDVRLECRKYAQKFLDLQREQFKRIGVFGQWDNPYSTMNPSYEAAVIETFFAFFENSFIYKGLRSVYWCIHDRTALAEAEVEYENHKSPSIYVRYKMLSPAEKIDPRLAGKEVYTIIWTTTPWTLPASRAVAFNKDFVYVALQNPEDGKVYIVARDLAEATKAACKLEDAKEIAEFPGSVLEHTVFLHPFLDRQIAGVLANYVTTEQGTGAVHTAPAHGADDFATGVKYQIELTCDVDASGRIHNGLPEYDGLQVFKANEPIVELVAARGALMGRRDIEHSYPHCWRCHNPIIFRATEQWFISMEAKMPDGSNESLRERALAEVKKAKWDPAWGEERISNMIATRPDWCISRQRIWGVPIAVFLCEKCGKPLNDKNVNRAVVGLFAKSGADAWYTPEADTVLPAGTKCPHCGSGEFKKETDILDVWFESGSSQAAVLGHDGLPWPADLYLEGGDQYRGWFLSSLFCALPVRGHTPFRMTVTPGWTLDEQGHAMSKSKGNDVDPVDIANRLGGEIVRLWVSSVDFRDDVAGSENLMQRVAENYRKIRNTFRYILGNLDGFDPAQHAVPFEKLDAIDQYMLWLTADMATDVQQYYADFAFHRIYQRVNHFCVVELSAFYFDVLKDRLYISAPNSPKRRAAQTAIWQIGEALVRLLAPIMSFTCEEIWGYLPAAGRGASVALAKFPAKAEIAGPDDAKAREDWTLLRGVREEVLKALEEARGAKLIGTGLEAQVVLTAAEPTYSVLTRYQAQLRYLFIVSAVTVQRGEASNGQSPLRVEIKKADGQKCERCWNYSTRVGEDAEYPTVCERCSAVLKEIEGG